MTEELERKLMIVDGKYNEGTSLLLQGELKAAREDFNTALENDARVMPKGVRSHYRNDIQSQLTSKLYKRGFEEYNRKHWEESFRYYLECAEVNRDDTYCLRGLQDLEERGEEAHEAARMFLRRGQTGQAIYLWKRIKDFTRPESLPYKNAVLQLMEYEK